jgi:hypothetical protein
MLRSFNPPKQKGPTVMRQGPDTTINGTRLNDAASQRLRVAIETLCTSGPRGIEAKGQEITAAVTERYLTAWVAIRKLLDNRLERI